MGCSWTRAAPFWGPLRKIFPERSHSSSCISDSMPDDLSAHAPSFALGLASHPAALSPHLQSRVTTGGTFEVFKRLLRTCSNWKSSFLSPGSKTHSFPSSLPALPQVKTFLFYQDGGGGERMGSVREVKVLAAEAKNLGLNAKTHMEEREHQL